MDEYQDAVDDEKNMRKWERCEVSWRKMIDLWRINNKSPRTPGDDQRELVGDYDRRERWWEGLGRSGGGKLQGFLKTKSVGLWASLNHGLVYVITLWATGLMVKWMGLVMN